MTRSRPAGSTGPGAGIAARLGLGVKTVNDSLSAIHARRTAAALLARRSGLGEQG